MKRITLILVFSILILSDSFTQTKWFNPLENPSQHIQGRAWKTEIANSYHRLPMRTEKLVRSDLYNLAKHSAGMYITFYSNAPEITVRYVVKGERSMNHMPATGVCGVDLYSTDCNGKEIWHEGQYAFSDTITRYYRDISYHNYHQKGNEFCLFLPLYTELTWMEIGVSEEYEFKFKPSTSEKPIVVYGTSIAQGACASRPGMAWTNIVCRRIDTPVINLGFSGNGRLEDEFFDLLSEIDAQIYIIDCMPNMAGERTKYIAERTIEGVKKLRRKSDAHILLVEHCGYMGYVGSDKRKEEYEACNIELKKAYKSLIDEGVQDLEYLTFEDLALSQDSQVDGIHASDLGMQEYADAYVKKINKILNRKVYQSSILQSVKQRREPNIYEWNDRHEEVLKYNKETQPEIVMIGNSITHYWGGDPTSDRPTSNKIWDELFKKKKVANLGFGWDQIGNVLWRLQHGELSGFRAEKVFMMIGTNNLHLNSDEEIVDSIIALAELASFYQPSAKIYALKILPRRGMEEVRLVALNNLLERRFPVSSSLQLIDISAGLTKDNKLDESLFRDGLHPNEKGYQVIATNLKQYVH